MEAVHNSRAGAWPLRFQVVFLVLVCCTLAIFIGWPAYRSRKERRAVANAAKYLNAGDFRNAAICARRALAFNPSNVAACQVMAALADSAGAWQALDWRRRIVELEPSIENCLHLAAAALKFEPAPWPIAADALHRLETASGSQPYLPARIHPTNRVTFHVLSAELALKANQPQRAEAHLVEASRLEPANPLHNLNVAALRLASTNPAVSSEARLALARLCSDTNIAPLALNWLIEDCLRRQDLTTAHGFSSRLMAYPGCTFQDRFRHLDLLRSNARPGFAPFLQATQDAARSNATAIHLVAAWMNGNGLATDAVDWLVRLPIALQKEQPVPLAIAESLAAAAKWSDLRSHLEKDKWDQAEFLRLAWLSRAAAQLRENAQADGNWRLAVLQAGDRLGPLAILAGLARDWDLGKPREDLLWRIIATFPEQRWAAMELDRRYSSAGNTRGLQRLYAALLSSPAADSAVSNNFATLSLLLGLNQETACRVAGDLLRQRPQDAIVVSTYAFSLHAQGRTREGLAALENLNAKELGRQPVALYYALLLCADGQAQKAARLLADIRVESLLPEEKQLLRGIRDTVPDGASSARLP